MSPRGSTAFAVELLGCALVVVGLLAAAPAVAGVSGSDCIEEAMGVGQITCTANDVRIGTLEVVGAAVTCDPTPISCEGGLNAGEACSSDGDCPDPFAGACLPEQVTVDLKATLISGPERYDIGLWLNETGGSARTDPTGSCYRDILTPQGTYPTDTTNDCDSVSGPYANGDADNCGDIPKTAGECANTVSVGTDLITEYTFTASVACLDGDTIDGIVETGACTSWSQNPDEIDCQSVTDAIPGAPSKCECNPVPISGLFSGCMTDAECDDGVGCTTDTCAIVGNVGTCSNTPVDSACDDGNVCTADSCDAVDDCQFVPDNTPDQCNDGGCIPALCDAQPNNPCTFGVCNADGTCAPTANVADSTPCEDGNVCTSETGTAQTPDHCEAGVCTGVPVDCSGEDDQCNVGVCNAGSGACEADPVADSTPCEDG
ncbi:MAG: hypothetical protein OES25_15385, partial [Acidobacteriota bacterium]|nr:hypothetical protein [Acidobacteriota bacterium]